MLQAPVIELYWKITIIWSTQELDLRKCAVNISSFYYYDKIFYLDRVAQSLRSLVNLVFCIKHICIYRRVKVRIENDLNVRLGTNIDHSKRHSGHSLIDVS
jgi:hypothetical protein